jgi:hypothetical protein
MKVVIAIKKSEPFKKLFVKTVEKEMFDKIVAELKKVGAADDKINSFIKENVYNDKVSYQFDLMCSKQTWEAVERYAELDCKIDFGVNEKEYCFAKISIVDGIEQVLSYNPDPNAVTVKRWACGAIPEVKKEVVDEQSAGAIAAESAPVVDDLPF